MSKQKCMKHTIPKFLRHTVELGTLSFSHILFTVKIICIFSNKGGGLSNIPEHLTFKKKNI